MMTIHALLKHKETAVHFHRVADENGQQNSHQTNIYETMHPRQSVWGNISMEFLEAFLFRVTTRILSLFFMLMQQYVIVSLSH